MKQVANMFEHRLGRGRERHRGNVGMPERQNPGPQEEVPVVIGAGKAEFCERIKTAANGGARETSGSADLRDRQVMAPLRECLNHGEATGERSHEIRIAGKGVAIGRLLGRSGWRFWRGCLPQVEFRQGKPSG